MKPLGDIIKATLKPFVKGSRYENCQHCEERRKSINNWWTKLIIYIKNIF